MTLPRSLTKDGAKHIAIIPARSGSKRLPNKNILPLAGKPLITWTIESAKSSGVFDKIIVSTDSEKIAKIAVDAGAEVPFLRASGLSNDKASQVDVCLDVITRLAPLSFEYITLLQPTSPLRTPKNIKEARQLFESRNADGVISVCPCEHPPQWCASLTEHGNMAAFLSNQDFNKRSQELEPRYRLNGAIYMLKISLLKESRSFFPKSDKIFSYIMNYRASVDIDTQWDFKLAEFALSESFEN